MYIFSYRLNVILASVCFGYDHVFEPRTMNYGEFWFSAGAGSCGRDG